MYGDIQDGLLLGLHYLWWYSGRFLIGLTTKTESVKICILISFETHVF